ncbi:MAG: M28 family peptidase [Bacteroidales bacterium]|jgi:hypothetical protein|nr:M28 family peptidase [Bacteroidales bacterium]
MILIRKVIIYIIFFVGITTSLFSQNVEKTKERVGKLSSQEFYGRGYVKDGVNKAADYIKKELETTGVKSFGNSYYQPFEYNINTFPSKMEVKIDGKILEPGIDYMIGPETPSINAKYGFFFPDSLLINNIEGFTEYVKSNDVSKKMLVLDYALINNIDIKWFYIYYMMSNPHSFGGIIELIPDELMYSVRTNQQKYPVVKIKREIFPENAKEISVKVNSKFIKNFQTKNIIAYIEGESDEFIVFSAHYDHLGTMGKDVYIPGAQDNASGTAMLLDLADYYSKNKPRYSIAFMFFSGEEAGLLGSLYYVGNPLFELSKIKAVVNLDLVGTGDDGITIVNGELEEYKNIRELFNEINTENGYFTEIKARGEAANSDHYPFHKSGIPAVFIYTMGGKTYYHHPKDTLETLTFTGYNQLFGLLIKFVERYE